MQEGILWTYFANSLLLITHQIDAAYWKEWELFGLKGGIAGFLLFNLFATALLLYGLILIIEDSPNGILFSFLMGVIGVFTFLIHVYFINKGRKEFRTATSLSILAAILIVSSIQILLSALLFFH